MHTISFFSFKGGVGRTNLLLNVAYGLARDGAFVVVADWDLHAPGLTVMERLHTPPPDGEPSDEPDVRMGVLDYLGAVLSQEPEIPDPASLAQPTRLGQAARAHDEWFWGDLWFIPAGRFDPVENAQEYHDQLLQVQSRDLSGWLASVGSGEAVQDPQVVVQYFSRRIAEAVLHPTLKRPPDYLLIDSRTGMTEIGDLLLGAGFAERMVLVTSFNDQNLAGLEAVIRNLQRHVGVGQLHNRLTVVASPVPQAEELLKRERMGRLEGLLDRLARDTGNGEKEHVPEIHPIPYHPIIALTETLMLEAFPESDPAQAFERVLDEIKRKNKELGRIQEETSLEIRQILEEARPEPPAAEPRRHRPVIPEHPWSRLPVWNWPDGNVTVEQFLPGVTENVTDILNGLARSISLTEAELVRTLDSLREMLHEQFLRLHENLREEQRRYGEVGEEQWENLLRSAVGHLLAWIKVWCERLGRDEGGVLAALTAGDLDSALGSWATNGFFWRALGTTLRDRDQWEWAERALQRATELEPSSPAAWVELANFRRIQLRRRDGVRDLYQKAIELDRQYASAWSGLGVLLAEDLDQLPEAESALRKATELEPDNALVWNQLGYFLADFLQQPEEAKRAFCRARDLDPSYTTPWQNDCEEALLEGNTPQARASLAQARTLLKNDYERRSQLVLELALAIVEENPTEAVLAHRELKRVNATLSKPTIWNYDEFAKFIARLPTPAQALLRAWIAAVMHQPGDDPDLALQEYLRQG